MVDRPPLSLVRVMLPYTLRDPYRLSHYTSPIYRALWPSAKEYLISLCECANGRGGRPDHAGLAGLRAVARSHVHRGLGRARTRRRRSTKADAEWDATTKRLGVDVAEGGLRAVPQAARAATPTTRSRSSGNAVHIT